MLKAKVVRRKHHQKLPDLSGPAKVKVGMVKGEADEKNINKALWNEFGTRGGAAGGGWGGPIPERPFLRNAMRENKDKYRRACRSLAKKVMEGKITFDDAMRQLGIMAQRDVQKSIKNFSDPPNSPLTIELKGDNDPLVVTGEMGNAVTYKVDK